MKYKLFFRLFVLQMLVLFSYYICVSQTLVDPCIQNTKHKIVVLGSSTAAGAGVSNPDSAWVNRYRNALQAINPQNEVINLAQGGYVTYRIMPDDFISPVPNRPVPNPDHNITKAISLAPDAIIINLPSNDRQYPAWEQLSNFDSLFNHGFNNGIPVWICTVQPILDPYWAAYQTNVKDSILILFGNYTIDFWTILADSNGILKPEYAADNVHLNDAGHAILAQRALDVDIPAQLFVPPDLPDYAITKIWSADHNLCGGPNTPWFIELFNFGKPGIIVPQLQFSATHNGVTNSQTVFLQDTLSSCTYDSVGFLINTEDPGWYSLTAVVHHPEDTISGNDTLRRNFCTVGMPDLQLINDTVCKGDNYNLYALPGPEDTVFWYENEISDSIIGGGSYFVGGPVFSDDTLYARAVRGLTAFRNSLFTTNNSN
ncbi:MAG: SGNH/GDSL hydrolase family protein, partial [Bacteroidales bacterium]|nr:SGNH/GDSL hydrolase family protein [Bacteroidales bacterium]